MIQTLKQQIPTSFKERYVEYQTAFRLQTGWLRVLPDFLIIGGQKCGTTSLFRYLEQHPNVMPPYAKEVHYFDLNYQLREKWYRSHFPSHLRMWSAKRSQPMVTGEASPYYLFYPHAAPRIAKLLPNVKIILLLRNPVDRAYSHYHHEKRKGFEEIPSFEAAFAAETERLREEWDRIEQDDRYISHAHRHFTYLQRGMYLQQLRRWYHYFPADQIFIHSSEAFYRDPGAVFKQVQAFLGLPEWEPAEYANVNRASYPDIARSTRRRLSNIYFKKPNQELYDFLGIDFGWEQMT